MGVAAMITRDTIEATTRASRSMVMDAHATSRETTKAINSTQRRIADLTTQTSRQTRIKAPIKNRDTSFTNIIINILTKGTRAITAVTQLLQRLTWLLSTLTTVWYTSITQASHSLSTGTIRCHTSKGKWPITMVVLLHRNIPSFVAENELAKLKFD